jgi:hypothetical protein
MDNNVDLNGLAAAGAGPASGCGGEIEAHFTSRAVKVEFHNQTTVFIFSCELRAILNL